MFLNDQQLVASFLVGDDDAFEELVKKYLKPVYNFLWQLTGDQSVLDDLTQVTFIKVWKNVKKFNQTKSFKVWVFAIAKNTAYDYFKKKKTIPFSFFEDAEGRNRLENISEDKIMPDEILAQADSANELEEKLKQIPVQYRIILNLHYKDDFSLAEIAAILQIPYNTAKSQHQRALQALRKLF